MKKSKKPIVGGILIGVGVLGIAGIATSENKGAMIFGVLALIAVGAILLIIGIKQNKKIVSATASSVQSVTPPTNVSSPGGAVDGNKDVDFLPPAQGELMKVYQYTETLCVIRDSENPFTYVRAKVAEGKRQLELSFEENNEYDDRAVALSLDGKKIGYVYRSQTQDMIHDFYLSKYEVAAHINTFTPDKITYKIAFYKPKSKCREFVVPISNAAFKKNVSEGDVLTVSYSQFEERYMIENVGEEYPLPNAGEEYVNRYFSVPVVVGEDAESIIFYK